ncbi:hypothetical protein EVAR_31423_1 [Eumeta japonica]|uniref:Helitron helicase-like domain-containing protein n=1 Tax=Eumeta variegata TaxID=151549 RepID=A0A4C1UXV9_EUMVA|nr:hypothetical protein EVAR_31423_1 [Eumeta japonica]
MLRKPSRKKYNFNRQDSSQENLEENPANEVSDQNQDLGTVFQENRFNQVNVQETFSLARPTRAAKTRCLQNLTRIINEETSYDLNVLQEHNRLRASQRVASESDELREQRLGDLGRRASHRVATEKYQRRRASENLASESNEVREQRLEDLRLRASHRVATGSDAQREHRLEEQRRRDIRRRRAIESNYLPTYKCTVNADQLYHALGSFEVLCIHCGALHFPEERVSNRINRNSFSDCCLHGRILIEPPKVPNELVRLFLKRHPHSEEFHKKIRNINASFALASFNVEDDRTINSRGIYSFIVCGQVYHKMNMVAHPTQNDEGVFERPLYGQLYFLDPDDAVNERVNHPLNSGISSSLMELLEYIIRARNGYVQGYRMMRDVEEDINRLSSAQCISPPYVKLLFRQPEQADRERYNIPVCNEVCAVFTLNADQSFPDNEMIVHQRNKNIVYLKKIHKRVEPFTYPLFYLAGTDGYSVDLPLQTPYACRNHLTRLELAQYRLSFRPECIKFSMDATLTGRPDLQEIPFNALHFGGRLFQQYLVDTNIRVERDRIQWIKYNQNKILAEQYMGVTRLINELTEKTNATVGEKIILPSSFLGSTWYYTKIFDDAMAIVRRLGSPNLFITMSSNPNWSEIKQAFQMNLEDRTILEQLPQSCPNIVARVAKLKFDQMFEDLDKKQIFGKIAAFVYTI